MTRISLAFVLVVCATPYVAAQPGPGAGQRERESVEQQVRARMGEVVQRRLGLNPQQMQQLKATSIKFDRDRVGLLTHERRVRMAMREQIEAGERGSQERISALLDSTLLLERRRLDLVESEQKQLATFLTPRQRAQFYGLQTQMRTRVEAVRRARGSGVRRIPPR